MTNTIGQYTANEAAALAEQIQTDLPKDYDNAAECIALIHKIIQAQTDGSVKTILTNALPTAIAAAMTKAAEAGKGDTVARIIDATVSTKNQTLIAVLPAAIAEAMTKAAEARNGSVAVWIIAATVSTENPTLIAALPATIAAAITKAEELSDHDRAEEFRDHDRVARPMRDILRDIHSTRTRARDTVATIIEVTVSTKNPTLIAAVMTQAAKAGNGHTVERIKRAALSAKVPEITKAVREWQAPQPRVKLLTVLQGLVHGGRPGQ